MARTEPFDRRADDYDAWFEKHRAVYLSELQAVRSLLPEHVNALEVGVGTGRFAEPLRIPSGIEPSRAMREIARARGIRVLDAVAEALPFGDGVFDLVLMVTTLCFLDEVNLAFAEAWRVLVPGGHLVVGFLDRDTELGQAYDSRRGESQFYRMARFWSSSDVLDAFRRARFDDLVCVQTICEWPGAADDVEPPESGCGKGLFVVMRGRKV